jgi:flagellar biosynthesis/type III secretory pathway protein FliH
MKSSFDSGMTRSAQIKTSAWRPVDFSSPTSNDQLSEIQTIERIFQSDGNLADALKLQKGLVKSPSIEDIPAWKPGEISFQPISAPFFEKQFFVNDAINEHSGKAETTCQDDPNYDQAEVVMAATQLKAQEILAQATNKAEEMARKGYLDGLNNAKAELASSFEAAENLLAQLQDFEKEILAQSESQVLGLIRSMAKTMFSEGIVLDDKTLHETFTEALENARSLGSLKVYLNPKDALNLNPDWRDDQAYISGQKMQFIPSEDILPGGCYVVGEQGSVDARIDSKLTSLLNVLTRRVEVE